MLIARTLDLASNAKLNEVLQRPICRISLIEDVHDECSQVTLWQSKKSGLRITSRVHNAADRLEVGVLTIQSVEDLAPEERFVDFQDLKPVVVRSLMMHENGITFESGLQFTFEGNRQLVILPSGFPFFITVSGDCITSKLQRAEYDLHEYEAATIFDLAVQQGN